MGFVAAVGQSSQEQRERRGFGRGTHDDAQEDEEVEGVDHNVDFEHEEQVGVEVEVEIVALTEAGPGEHPPHGNGEADEAWDGRQPNHASGERDQVQSECGDWHDSHNDGAVLPKMMEFPALCVHRRDGEDEGNNHPNHKSNENAEHDAETTYR